MSSDKSKQQRKQKPDVEATRQLAGRTVRRVTFVRPDDLAIEFEGKVLFVNTDGTRLDISIVDKLSSQEMGEAMEHAFGSKAPKFPVNEK